MSDTTLENKNSEYCKILSIQQAREQEVVGCLQ